MRLVARSLRLATKDELLVLLSVLLPASASDIMSELDGQDVRVDSDKMSEL